MPLYKVRFQVYDEDRATLENPNGAVPSVGFFTVRSKDDATITREIANFFFEHPDLP